MADVKERERAATSLRSRDSVTRALLDLLRRGDLRPSAEEVAEAAGVSVRTIFRLFDDLDKLFAAAVASHARVLAPMLAVPPTSGTLEHRVGEFARQRSALLEELSPVRRAALLRAPFSAEIRHGHDLLGALLRGQVETVFAIEIEATPEQRRQTLVDCLDGVTSWQYWERLRTRQCLDTPAAEAVVTSSLRALLLASGTPSGRY